jgi:hypothetical protein
MMSTHARVFRCENGRFTIVGENVERVQRIVDGERARLETMATRAHVMGWHVCVLLDDDVAIVYYGLTITFCFVTLTIGDRQDCR